MADKPRVEGRVAVVTGGVSGSGPAVARRLAADGARLAIWDMNAAALGQAGAQVGAKVHTERLDLAEKTVKNYVSGLLAKLGMERRTQAAVYGARRD